MSAKSAVEVEVGPLKPWEQIMDGLTEVVAGSRAEFRRSQGVFADNESKISLGGGHPVLDALIEVDDDP